MVKNLLYLHISKILSFSFCMAKQGHLSRAEAGGSSLWGVLSAHCLVWNDLRNALSQVSFTNRIVIYGHMLFKSKATLATDYFLCYMWKGFKKSPCLIGPHLTDRVALGSSYVNVSATPT